MEKKEMKSVPCTKAMVQRSQAAERRILMNKQFVDPDEARLCQRLKEYYARELTWVDAPMDATEELTYEDSMGRVHCGVPRLVPFLVELRRDYQIGRRMHEWSQLVRVYVFAVFDDGFKVGLRLDIPLLLLEPERPQALVQPPPLGSLNVLSSDRYETGHHLVMRYHPVLGCFVATGDNADGACSERYADEYEQEYLQHHNIRNKQRKQ